MGEFAADVQARLRDRLAERVPGLDWETERRVAGTPVDVVGEGRLNGVERDGDHPDRAGSGDDLLVLLELEWRRADPADNAAKLFRHVEDGALDAADRIVVVQAFTGYYDLQRGGVSAKRENAEFVGRVAAREHDRLTYHPIGIEVDPPKAGGERPAGWQAAVDDAADAVAGLL